MALMGARFQYRTVGVNNGRAEGHVGHRARRVGQVLVFLARSESGAANAAASYRRSIPRLTAHLDAGHGLAVTQPHIQHRDIGPRLRNEFQGLSRVSGVSYHNHILVGPQQVTDSRRTSSWSSSRNTRTGLVVMPPASRLRGKRAWRRRQRPVPAAARAKAGPGMSAG
jgi:hypothetical protein